MASRELKYCTNICICVHSCNCGCVFACACECERERVMLCWKEFVWARKTSQRKVQDQQGGKRRLHERVISGTSSVRCSTWMVQPTNSLHHSQRQHLKALTRLHPALCRYCPLLLSCLLLLLTLLLNCLALLLFFPEFVVDFYVRISGIGFV